ncbi:phage tail protein [Prosthecomicrobium pneumaticum]|uniref:Microcystin-dependent protein n=1 Tax=Prosthecomicrobium pneumaticum TaxID=81895 RepID=A0A7W9L1N1_9HYPH|nr:tail fiber protein [Prosthecomicrobium pneumaticum]MBB5752871.1 microcystin-dependent protein [Prosthecomicrobium pneumaticum]
MAAQPDDRYDQLSILDGVIGQVALLAMNAIPRYWTACDGKILQIDHNQTLFSLIGNAFGGDGLKTFAVPDLRTAVPIHRPAQRGAGVKSADPQMPAIKLTTAHLPAHTHKATFTMVEGKASGSVTLTVVKKAGTGTPTDGGFLGLGGSAAAAAPIYVKPEDAKDVKDVKRVTLNSVAVKPTGEVNIPFKGEAPLVIPYLKMIWCICIVGIYPKFSEKSP